MDIAIEDLSLNQLYVVYPGERNYSMGERIEAIPLDSNLSSIL